MAGQIDKVETGLSLTVIGIVSLGDTTTGFGLASSLLLRSFMVKIHHA